MSESVSTHVIARDWLAAGRRVVAATLVERIGSAPLDPGAQMLIADDGRIEGTVTGGCVEAALVEQAQRILAGEPPRTVTYGISQEQAADVGLMCGGTVRVFVHELTVEAAVALAAVEEARAAGHPVALATLLDGERAGAKLAIGPDGTSGGFGLTPLLDRVVAREAQGLLHEGLSRTRRFGAGGELMGDDLAVHIQAFAKPPAMVIFGAIDFSAAVARFASGLGYRVTICDARRPFAESERFRMVADVVVDWPDRYLEQRELGPRDVVLVFTHDPKFDEPALVAALRSGAGYIGALGSRRTHAERSNRLRAAGVADADIARIHAPTGLDLGARTSEETAVSILAEIIAHRTGRSADPLSETSGPIHAPAVDET